MSCRLDNASVMITPAQSEQLQWAATNIDMSEHQTLDVSLLRNAGFKGQIVEVIYDSGLTDSFFKTNLSPKPFCKTNMIAVVEI